MALQYESVICGGTFDGLHVGHQVILRKAFEVGKRVTIGLTSDEYIVKFKYRQVYFHTPERNINLYQDRKRNLIEWLEKERYYHRATIVPIHDPYGPTIPGSVQSSESHEAIVVSTSTRPTAEQINLLRARSGWPMFAIVEVPLVLAEDGQPIASERIRDGEIDVSGHLILPDDLRLEMQKPLGTLIMRDSDVRLHVRKNIHKVLITVGDVATKKLMDMSVMPTLAIIDLCVGRKPFQSLEAYEFPRDAAMTRVVSGPGYISQEAQDAIKDWSEKGQKNTVIVVEGEEDLLVLPVVMHAPMGGIIYYGQPKSGMVVIEITEEKKAEATDYIRQFIR